MNKDTKKTGNLIRLCLGYFLAYVGTGVCVKYFTELSSHPLSQVRYLIANTLGSVLVVFLLIFFLGWFRPLARSFLRKEGWPIVVSGLCTAVIIPATTLMYLLPVSVMVAMILMRASVIVVSRLVDAVLIHQEILKKSIPWQENAAVLCALLAIGTNILSAKNGSFDFLESSAAVGIMTFYVIAYAVRIYIMNYYKHSASLMKLDNRSFFVTEQTWAAVAMALGLTTLLFFGSTLGVPLKVLTEVKLGVLQLDPWAVISGIPYAGVAFFSVFIFMFRGRTATFAGVVNRVTSLLAGTASTLLLALIFDTRAPSTQEWVSLIWIGIAIALLAWTELKQDQLPPAADKKLSVFRGSSRTFQH